MHEFWLAGVVKFFARRVERLAPDARGGVIKDVARNKWKNGRHADPPTRVERLSMTRAAVCGTT